MFARERLFLNAERNALYPDGHQLAAFLYAAVGDEIPDSAAEKFGLVDGELKKSGKPKIEETLLGSNVLPALVEIAAGKTVQLGVVVGRAYKASGLNVDGWNALEDAERETRLAQMVETLKQEHAARPPRTPATPKPKKAAGKKEQAPAGDKEQKTGENKGGAGGSGEQQPAT
ncbi:hypothetical protein [Devosia sp.]|uniref:hypothetical protein n=1 Tax=Devosia sp. TaxID=1871048 RepID=UPI001ACBB9ED|nr:hypothetical protein [Devosia sp.]MBN9333868.1 hypothetical protein [Devosia sp.]